MLSEKYAGVEKLKACRTKEELLDITARYAPSVFPVRFPSPDRKPTAETVRDAILYARLGAEIAKVMDAEGYGNHPAEDAFRYYHRAEPLFRDIALSVMEHELRKGLLREERSRAPDLSEEEIVERITREKPVDLLSTAETILRAYLFDPDFPLPKCEAERILARVRLPSDSILSMTDDVDAVCVVGIPDKNWGEAIAAAIVKKHGSDLDDERALKYCADHLGRYKRPKHILFLDSLPTTSVGKISHPNVKKLFMKALGRE